MTILVKFALLSIILASCAQEPAKITYKGHMYFTKNTFAKKVKNTPVKQVKNSNYEKKNISDSANSIVIAKGDNIYSLARKHKITTRSLIEHNNLKPPYVIYPGEELAIPTQRKTHVVQSGENLTKISRLYDVSLKQLADVNNVSNNYKIKTGEILILPYDARVVNSISTNTKKLVYNKKSSRPIVVNNKIKKEISKKITFIWPVKSGAIIQKFGQKPNGTHNDGINIKGVLGSPVKSVAAGKVVYVGNGLRGYGNLIIIKHPNNWLTAYAHNNDIYVAKNQMVKQGEVISTLGSTGNVTTPQLHFVLRKGRTAVNPEQYLKEV